MVDPARIYLWAFDARPYPAFPDAADVWSDGANWALGHWLTGRLGLPSLDRLVPAALKDFRVTQGDATGLPAMVPGLVVDRPMSARDVLDPLASLFRFDARDRAGTLVFRHSGAGPAIDVAADHLVADKKGALVSRM